MIIKQSTIDKFNKVKSQLKLKNDDVCLNMICDFLLNSHIHRHHQTLYFIDELDDAK